jgi:hypothetical protein
VKNDFIKTRRNDIRLPPDFPCKDFFDDPFLVLHGYYNVLEHWNKGKLSVLEYSIEYLAHGSSDGMRMQPINLYAIMPSTTLKQNVPRLGYIDQRAKIW